MKIVLKLMASIRISGLAALAVLSIPGIALSQSLSPQKFLDAVRTAMKEKDPAQLVTLTYTVGLDGNSKERALEIYQAYFSNHVFRISNVTLNPLPINYRPNYVADGWRCELTHAPIGCVQVQETPVAGGPPIEGAWTLPYAIIEGGCYLVPEVCSSVGWKGPPDHSLTIGVTNVIASKTIYEIEWNASGVEQRATVRDAGVVSVHGQYLEKVIAKTAAELPGERLFIELADGKDRYVSSALHGNATAIYQRK